MNENRLKPILFIAAGLALTSLISLILDLLFRPSNLRESILVGLGICFGRWLDSSWRK